MGVPVGVRANLALALAPGRYDVVHGFEPGLPSLSYLALRDAQRSRSRPSSRRSASATRPAAQRDPPAHPGRRAARDSRERTARGGRRALPRRLPRRRRGHRRRALPPGGKRDVIALEWRPSERPLARARAPRAARAPGLGARARCARSRCSARPFVPARSATASASGRRALGAVARGALERGAIFVPAPLGPPRGRASRRPPPARRSSARRASRSSPSSRPPRSPAWPRTPSYRERGRRGARGGRGAELRGRRGRARRALRALAGAPRAAPDGDPLADRPWILATCTCTRLVARLRGRAAPSSSSTPRPRARRDRGHRPQRLRRRARGGRAGTGPELVVIPGEEVKTDAQGEVIGLFLEEEIPRGCRSRTRSRRSASRAGSSTSPTPSTACTDPDAATIQRHLADIDVFEVYNARLLFETYNEEALRFARKYGLQMGAGRTPTCCRASGPAPCGCARSRGLRSSCSASAAPQVLRRPRSLALPPVAQVDGAGQGKGPLIPKL